MDEIVCLTLVLAAVCVGTFNYPKEWFLVSAKSGSETYFIAFAHVLQLLQVAIAILLLIGVVGMAIQAETSLWIFWQMFYLPSVAIVFFVCPILNLAASVWGIAGFFRLKYGLQAIAVIIVLVLTFALDIGLDYLFEALARRHILFD